MVSRRVCGGLRFEIRRNVRGIDCPSCLKLLKKEFGPRMRVTQLLYTSHNNMAYILSFLKYLSDNLCSLSSALIRHYPKNIHKESIHMFSNSDRPQLYFLNAPKRPNSTMYIAANLVSIIHFHRNFLIPRYFSSTFVLLLIIIKQSHI